MEFEVVAHVDDIEEGELVGYDVGGGRVVIGKVDGRFYALGGVCTHAWALLEEGDLEGFDVVCPEHFAAFDLRTGAVTSSPAELPADVHEVRVHQGDVLVSTTPTTNVVANCAESACHRFAGEAAT